MTRLWSPKSWGRGCNCTWEIVKGVNVLRERLRKWDKNKGSVAGLTFMPVGEF